MGRDTPLDNRSGFDYFLHLLYVKMRISDIFAWTFLIIGMILLLWKVFGNSPTVTDIILAVMIGMLFKMITLGSDIAVIKEKLNHIDRKFNALANDFKEHSRHK